MLFANTLVNAQGTPEEVAAEDARDASAFAKKLKKLSVQQKTRKKELIKTASADLDDTQRKLLTQLLDENGDLGEVLSSQPYLTYLKAKVGAAYENYPKYLEAMPVPKLKARILFEFKEFFPEETTPAEMRLCIDYYFKLRKLLTLDISVITFPEKLAPYQFKHFSVPLMKNYSKEEIVSKFSSLMQLGTIPPLFAGQAVEVFHDAWAEKLRKYGLEEGLLRCAVAAPAEFALTYSFFEDAETFKKWILTPLKTDKKIEDR